MRKSKMANGSFRRVSVAEQSTLTSSDHGPLSGNGSIPRHTIKKSQRELNETEEKKKIELATLRKLMDKKLKSAKDDKKQMIQATYDVFHDASDDMLIRFLRSRKFDSIRTWELMMGYTEYRTRYPDVLKVKECEARQWVEQGQPGILPKRDSQGRVVMFFKLEKWDPEEFPFTKAMEIFVFVLERLLENAETQINGVCIIEDFNGYTLGQMAAVGVNDYKQMVDMLQIHVHGKNLDSFYNEFPKKFLPEDLGGTGPPYDGKAAANMLFGTKEEIDENTAM